MMRRFSSFGSLLAACALGAGLARAQAIQYVTLDGVGHFVQTGTNSDLLESADIEATVGGSGITGTNTTASFTAGGTTYTLTPNSNGLYYESAQFSGAQGGLGGALSAYSGAGNFVLNGTVLPTLSLPSTAALVPNLPIITVQTAGGSVFSTFVNGGTQNAVLDITNTQNIVVSTNLIGANYSAGSALINLGMYDSGGSALATVSSSNAGFSVQSESFTINASQLIVGQTYDINVQFDTAVDAGSSNVATEPTPDTTTVPGAIAVANLERNSDLTVKVVASAIPEPSTYALFAGIAVLGAMVGRRWRLRSA